MRKKKTPGPMGWVGMVRRTPSETRTHAAHTPNNMARKRMRVHTRLGRYCNSKHLAWCVHCVGCDDHGRPALVHAGDPRNARRRPA